MTVDAKTVRQMAALARLTVSDDRIDGLATEMNTILEFMGAITAWDGSITLERTPATRRPDVPNKEDGSTLVEAASNRDGNSVVVPPVKGAS